MSLAAVKEVASSGELVWNLALRELRGRYKRSALGWFWSMLNPLSTMVIYSVVFGVILKSSPPPGQPSGLDVFALFLLCGLLPWTFFAVTVSTAMYAVLGNASLIKKVYFPRESLVLSVTIAGLVTFGIELGVLLVALMVFGNFVLPWIPVLILLVALLAVFATGVALILSSLNVFFRDLGHLWGIVTQAWFFLTPIVYPLSIVPSKLRTLLQLNPMTVFANAFRDVLYDLRFPAWDRLLALLVGSFAVLAFGFWVFGRLSPRFAEEV